MDGDEHERRFPFLFLGLVTDRADPEGLGRVKIEVPGLIEPQTPGWAWPLGVPGGGSRERGTFEPPAIGAQVAVFFVHGLVDHPCYFTGPWGAPGGSSDIPEGGIVEADDRQNAVTEDEEWKISRDSRAASPGYTVRHRNSSQAIRLDATADQVHLARETATQGAIRGTEYRSAEVGFLAALVAALATFASATAAATSWVDIKTAGGALSTALAGLPNTEIMTNPTDFVSTKVLVE